MKVRVGLALALALLAGCSSKKITGPKQNSNSSTNQQDATQVNQYLEDSLPNWPDTLADKAAAPTGATTVSHVTVPSVTTIDTSGTTKTSTNKPYVCETTPYSLQSTPQQVVMYTPNEAVLYPGAFVQGASYETGNSSGDLRALSIAQRAPIQVSIPDVPSGTNTQTVDMVTEANVEAAVGKIIGNAVADDLQTPSKIQFQMQSYDSQQQAALAMGLSGHYLGFSAAAGGSITTAASEHTVVAQFYEQMYTVVVARPTTTTTGPAAWFQSGFTMADLQQQVANRYIGAKNLPLYLGQIMYGRMMMFSVTSTASVSDIKATLNASYNGLFASGGVSLSAEQSKILSTATIKIASVGGPEAATLKMIQSGNYKSYFTQTAPLSTAAPLTYYFYDLANDAPARVTESTDYNETTCSPVPPGQFEFLPPQSFAPPVPTPFDTRLVDVNGDGRADLVFNHRDATSNEIAVALGQADGTFAAPGAAVSVPGTPPTGWGNYYLTTGDFNGDGMADLVWNEPDSAIYVALADASGGWTFESRQEAHIAGSDWLLSTGDIAKYKHPGQKICDDLIWLPSAPASTGTAQDITLMVSKCDGTFLSDTIQLIQNVPADTYASGGLATWVVDVNGDGLADLVFNESPQTGTSETEVATSNGDGTFSSSASMTSQIPANGWNGYLRMVADFTGDGHPDLLFYRTPRAAPSQLYLLSGMGIYGTWLGPQPLTSLFAQGQYEYVTPVVGDVNDDGKADLLLDHVTNSADSIAVDLGTSGGLGLPPDSMRMQTDPVSTNWVNALPPMAGDVNGDHNADVVWVIPGSPTKVFVALSKGNATGS